VRCSLMVSLPMSSLTLHRENGLSNPICGAFSPLLFTISGLNKQGFVLFYTDLIKPLLT
jgi:hypothetical protein